MPGMARPNLDRAIDTSKRKEDRDTLPLNHIAALQHHQAMAQYSIAYLDLLGFKSYTLDDPEGARQLLDNYDEIINQKLTDARQFPPASYTDPESRNLAQAINVDTFDYFLPFSDSIIVASQRPDQFIVQLSTFLIGSFEITAEAFRHPEDSTEPAKVTIKTFSSAGLVGERQAHWYPVLFRGGISSGNVRFTSPTAIVDCAVRRVSNVSGMPVVNSVGLEKTGKGPRIFCDCNFVESLAGDSRKWFSRLNDVSRYELLWPAFMYHDSNAPHVEINEFETLFGPAAHLWQALNHVPEAGPHYFEFLKLIIKSTTKWFNLHGGGDLARDYIKSRISAHNLAHKMKVLMSDC